MLYGWERVEPAAPQVQGLFSATGEGSHKVPPGLCSPSKTVTFAVVAVVLLKAQHTQTQQGLFVADNATRIKKCFAEELRGSDSSSGLKNELRRNREKKKILHLEMEDQGSTLSSITHSLCERKQYSQPL